MTTWARSSLCAARRGQDGTLRQNDATSARRTLSGEVILFAPSFAWAGAARGIAIIHVVRRRDWGKSFSCRAAFLRQPRTSKALPKLGGSRGSRKASFSLAAEGCIRALKLVKNVATKSNPFVLLCAASFSPRSLYAKSEQFQVNYSTLRLRAGA
jgi:hypothetical protein